MGLNLKTTAHLYIYYINILSILYLNLYLSLIIFPVYNLSLSASVSETMREAALVVGIPKACMASEHKNSLTDDLKILKLLNK